MPYPAIIYTKTTVKRNDYYLFCKIIDFAGYPLAFARFACILLKRYGSANEDSTAITFY